MLLHQKKKDKKIYKLNEKANITHVIFKNFKFVIRSVVRMIYVSEKDVNEKEKTNEKDKKQQRPKCEICGGDLVFQEGCVLCVNCGGGKCDT